MIPWLWCTGLESVASLHEEVETKSKAQRRTLQTIQSFGTSKEKEAKKQGDTSGGLVTLQMMFEGTGLKGGLDILAVSHFASLTPVTASVVSPLRRAFVGVSVFSPTPSPRPSRTSALA